MIHDEPHTLAGQTVKLNARANDPLRAMVNAGSEFRIEDWVDRLDLTDDGKSLWDSLPKNWATAHYVNRATLSNLPTDDEVVYGKINGLGHCVHVCELGELV